MLRVTIELLPHGDETKKKLIGRMDIWNTTSGTPNRGNYIFRLFAKGTNRIWFMGEIDNFPRKTLTAWDLLYRCLNHITRITERNKDDKRNAVV